MAMTQILRLKPAFTDQQAEALAGLFDDELATKADLERLRLELGADVQRLALETKAGADSLRAEIEKLRLEVQRDIKDLENRILSRMMTLFIGQGLAVVSLVIALQRLLS